LLDLDDVNNACAALRTSISIRGGRGEVADTMNILMAARPAD